MLALGASGAVRENGIMNQALRRAFADADLTEVDVAVRCEVDPKTVRAWVSGRLPYPRNRRKIAKLIGRDEADLWPERDAVHATGDIRLAYPHRWAVPRDEWISLFASARREIGILAYAGLFLAEDEGVRDVLARQARAGVRVRILLGDPSSRSVGQRGADEGIGDAMAAKVRNALKHYRTLGSLHSVQIRLHDTVLYASMYRADDELLANLHAYGLAAAQAPVFRVRAMPGGDVARLYLNSFERVWATAAPHQQVRAGHAS
jgi:phosphatidylserine/phosphatidylglycerophosphate/cardiolipin synthase-like enzyme